MRILLIGLGPTALTALDSLHDNHNVVGVVRNVYPTDEARSMSWSPRDLDNWIPGRRLGDALTDPVVERACALDVPVHTDTSPAAIGRLVTTERPDCVVVSSYNRLLPSSLLTATRCVNVHYTPLPRYRGRGEWMVVNDEPVTAITIHVIDGGVDTGNILFQQMVPISDTTTVTEVNERLNAIQRIHLGRVVADHLAGDGGAVQQHSAATYGCTTDCDVRAGEFPSDGEIDWSHPTRKVDCLVRGLAYPWPGAHTYLHGERLTVWRAAPATDPLHFVGRVPGRVVQISPDDGWVDVLTGDGVLRLTEVQRDGEPPCRAAAVVRSLSDTLGVRTGDLIRRIGMLEQQIAVITHRVAALESASAG